MPEIHPPRWRVLPALALFLLLLTGCRATPIRTLPLDTRWGRGLLVGVSQLHEAPAMQVDERGEGVQLVWGSKQAGRIDLHAARIQRDRGVVSDVDLGTGLFLPRRYRLFTLANGERGLLTLAKPHKEGIPGVFYLRLSPQGDLLAPAQRITPDDARVVSYDALLRPDGALDLVWEARRPEDDARMIFHRRLTGLDAEPAGGDPILLVERGQGPSLFRDAAGALHLLWHLDRELEGDRIILYAPLGDAPAGPVEGVQIKRHGRNPGLRFSSPALTGDDGHLYAFWHLERLSGLSAGTASVTVISFPAGRPDQTREFDIAIPEGIPGREAWPQEGDFIPFAAPAGRLSGYVLYPGALQNSPPGDRAILLMTAKLTYRMKSELQPVMVALADGGQAGYAPIARSRFISSKPVGASDDAGNLYAAWLDYRGAGKYLVLLSTTSRAWMQGALQLTRSDMMDDIAGEVGFGLLAASALIPMLLFIFLL
ncbi:MAG TPA: hypothetical protein ENK30_02940, partial [Anaerolineae bacterium]|nr:hypothetical protein [Anaerolineae bacterium]